jgi:hypothetical protein
MVSKLQLAVQECCLKAIEEGADKDTISRLLDHYYEINEGVGVHKSPELYGAFPTDPYSHTPQGKGAQQPGMTGQVKEDILSRYGELGVLVKEGKLGFNPVLLREDEFFDEGKTYIYVDLNGKEQQQEIAAGSLCFTFCQVPVVYKLGETAHMELTFQDGTSKRFDSLELDLESSKQLFQRTGAIKAIHVNINSEVLR